MKSLTKNSLSASITFSTKTLHCFHNMQRWPIAIKNLQVVKQLGSLWKVGKFTYIPTNYLNSCFFVKLLREKPLTHKFCSTTYHLFIELDKIFFFDSISVWFNCLSRVDIVVSTLTLSCYALWLNVFTLLCEWKANKKLNSVKAQTLLF